MRENPPALRAETKRNYDTNKKSPIEIEFLSLAPPLMFVI